MDSRKRGRFEATGSFNRNGGPKRSRQEMESTGVGSKLKPCTKFFSTSGCPFGDSCHFLHHVPGGYQAVAQMMNLPDHIPPASRNVPSPASGPNAPGPNAVKSRMCKWFASMEGCKFGDRCNFAHGDWELGKPVGPTYDDPRGMGHLPAHHMTGRMEPPVHSATGFGASASTEFSVETLLAGAIIGKGGVHSKEICRQTGVKLSVRDHESDPNLRNIELQGTFDQIDQASAMVRELIGNLRQAGAGRGGGGGRGGSQGGGRGRGGGGEFHGPPQGSSHQPRSNFKTKLCDNFTKGSCTFGDQCHFAHGGAEMRKTGL